MRTFLDDFVGTLSFRGQKRAFSILEDAKIEKAQLSLIADKLSAQSMFAALQLKDEQNGSLIGSGSTEQAIGDVVSRLTDIYDQSNSISLLLSSSTSVLTADIQSLEDELNALEKSIANYSFLLADGGTYDYAFLEPFNDTRNSEDFDFTLTDRNGLIFSKEEKALVVADEGVVVLPQNIVHSFPLDGKMIDCNCSAFISSANSLVNAFNARLTSGWRISIASPAPISSTLPSFRNLYNDITEFPGVNAVLELTLPSPAPCDNVKINPFSDAPFDIVQIELFPDLNEDVKFPLLQAPVSIDSSRSFYFKLQPVAKIKLYIRQSLYRRNALQPIVSETIYRKVIANPMPPVQVINTKTVTYNRIKRVGFISRLVQRFIKIGIKAISIGVDIATKTASSNQFEIEAPTTMYMPQWGSFQDDLSKIASNHRVASLKWVNQTVKSSAMEAAAFGRLSIEFLTSFLPQIFIQTRIVNVQNNTQNPLPNAPIQPMPQIVNDITYITPEQFKYEYNIGINNVQIGNALTGFKGIFISKILPSPSDVGEVKIKASDIQFVDNNLGKDQPLLTSVEYSVSNQAKPDAESDWVPILPTGVDQISGERFFVDATGKGTFIFGASLTQKINLYKNGYLIKDFDVNSFLIRSSNLQWAIGLKIPSNYITTQDILTVDYTPIVDSSVVNFENAGYSIAPLVSSFDANGAGEGFTGTAGQLILDLLYEPYIDYNQVSTSTYSSTAGLTPYNPIIVIFNDGTFATNLTNYKEGGIQTLLNAGSDPSFIHNGTSLMFNKPLDAGFRVYYQYLPNNLRFRVVLRANASEYVSPKVDFVQIKAKTRKADARGA